LRIVNVTVEMTFYHLSLLHWCIIVGDVSSRCQWLSIVISYYCAIIRTNNYDRVITIVKCAMTSQANRNCITVDDDSRWRSGWIMLRYAYVLLARCYSQYCSCNLRRNEYNAVPDKMKIKNSVTESWSLFIFHQHDGSFPISFLALSEFAYEIKYSKYVRHKTVHSEFPIFLRFICDMIV